MDKYIFDESNGLWGQQRKCYLRENKAAFYTTLLTSGKLNTYIA